MSDAAAFAYAVDALTGQQIWKVKLEDYPVARITGTSVFYNGRLYFPMSSGEELGSQQPGYVCCKFRGSLSAVDAATGRVIWKTYTIAQEAKVYKTIDLQGKDKSITKRDLWGPAGASIWSAPTIDVKRKRIDGQQLHRRRRAHQRRHHGVRHGDRQGRVGEAGDGR